MNVAGARRTLDAAPRFALGHWPTPLEPCHRLQEAVGGPLVWLKRDDCSGLAVGGNKTRKLEYLLGDALAQRCDGVVTFGALQSNHARQTAAACAPRRADLRPGADRAVPRTDVHYLQSGNLLLDQLLGAQLHVVDDPDAAFVRFAELLGAGRGRRSAAVRHRARRVGPVGTLGYVRAAIELADQVHERALDVQQLVVAASTAGTAAGLAVGTTLAGWAVPVHAVCVYHDVHATRAELEPLQQATAAALGEPSLGGAPVELHGSALGPGYGVPTTEAQAAIELVARTEGVLLDPVYTAKAFAHLLGRIAQGELEPDRDVVFVHTGGSPGCSPMPRVGRRDLSPAAHCATFRPAVGRGPVRRRIWSALGAVSAVLVLGSCAYLGRRCRCAPPPPPWRRHPGPTTGCWPAWSSCT